MTAAGGRGLAVAGRGLAGRWPARRAPSALDGPAGRARVRPPCRGRPPHRVGPRAGSGRRTGSDRRARPGRDRACCRTVAFAGPDAVRYALSRAVPSGSGPGRRIRAIDPRAAAAQHLGNPFYAVRYAHAHAASILRWSADLGLPAADVAQFQPRLLAHPREQALLDACPGFQNGWPGSAPRPATRARRLPGKLSGTYLDWQEACSVSQPGAFPPDRTCPDQASRPDRTRPPGQAAALAGQADAGSAARTVLGTGLGLLGVAAPDRAS